MAFLLKKLKSDIFNICTSFKAMKKFKKPYFSSFNLTLFFYLVKNFLHIVN